MKWSPQGHKAYIQPSVVELNPHFLYLQNHFCLLCPNCSILYREEHFIEKIFFFFIFILKKPFLGGNICPFFYSKPFLFETKIMDGEWTTKCLVITSSVHAWKLVFNLYSNPNSGSFESFDHRRYGFLCCIQTT
jgi:hypothetical protein